MSSRERIRTIIAGQPADRCGLWLGNPHEDTWPILHRYFNTTTEEDLRRKLGDDFRWFPADLFPGVYCHPKGRQMFDLGMEKHDHGQAGPFADIEDVRQLDSYEWPNPKYLSFDPCLKAIEKIGNFYRASGFWTSFYHNVMDYFGMEKFMMNMYENPELVHAVTDRVCSFYYEANERLFNTAGDLIDGFFFGNDLGTQLDLICGPRQFDEFILPWIQKFTALAHRHGYQVILHSCGSIHKVIDRLIDAKVNCLHPLQTKACNMDAETLARDFKGKIAFMGGIDTQYLLVHGTHEEIQADVRRVKELLGPCLIVSPSHEALLPDVPPENVRAMVEAAR